MNRNDLPITRHFSYAHLPEYLRAVSAPCCALVDVMLKNTAPGAEQSAGLRKLLEAKDCFVRAAIEKRDADKKDGEP